MVRATWSVLTGASSLLALTACGASREADLASPGDRTTSCRSDVHGHETSAPVAAAGVQTAGAEDVGARVQAILVRYLHISPELAVSAPDLAQDANADSCEVVEVVMAVEEEFGIEVPDDAAERLPNYQAIVAYVEARLRERAATS
ncbi:hypothetical protein E2493_13240 [Sphingomonas parva]|uniref:Acyl carrier protein n=1 Tax=Sphingomonas parva TaxID=2555898 RepID=A0A4Y8ZTJ9_9SPHN|nr:phosphopantetheine-binding protein [Sphingomonas parva]TFI57786.1 hypothetical protein E2493_13240 [Sphingomonas parva]